MSRPRVDTQTPQEASLATHIGEGVSMAVGSTIVAREAVTQLADPTLEQTYPFNAEMSAGIFAGFTLTVAAEALATRLRSSGRERAGELVDRSKKVIAWAGSTACQLAFAAGEAANTGDTKMGIITGLASTTFGIAIGNRYNRMK